MNNPYPWKQALTTGIAVSITALIAFSIAERLNQHFNWGFNPVTLRGLTGLLTLVILAVGIYTAINSVKRHNEGRLTYGQAVITGVIVASITGIISALVTFIYCRFLNPGYAAFMVAESKKVMLANGKSSSEIAASTADLKKQMTVGMQVMQSIVGQALSGTIIALIMGAFVKTRK